MDQKCSRCESTRLVDVTSECIGLCAIGFKNTAISYGYIPRYLGLGENNVLELQYCLECGQLQGDFPKVDPQNFIKPEPESKKEVQ